MSAGPVMTGFGRVLRAEWTKFRTVRGWVAAVTAAAAVIVGLGLLPGRQGSCGRNGPGSECELPVGPGGERVSDAFTFAHRTLAGDGSVTVRVASLTGRLPPAPDADGAERAGLAPWAKAGLIIKDGRRPGSTYAAVMVTGAHGTRMQSDFVHDLAGQPDGGGPAPRWLRLVRTGHVVTGQESVDGTQWTTVGFVDLPGLPASALVGLFVTSPQYTEEVGGSFGLGAAGGPTRATATFDHVDVRGTRPGEEWTADTVGGGGGSAPPPEGFFQRVGEELTLSGSGDIAPAVAGAAGLGASITDTLVGTFAGLIMVVVVGAMFVTAEYRRGLIRTTLVASPGRGRVLAAKALVAAAAAGAAGLVAAGLVVTLGPRMLRDNGVYVYPAAAATHLRVVAGTAVLLAIAAVLGVALGAVLRRGVAAVAVAVVGTVLPYLLAVAVLPDEAARWLLRVTPAAGFAVQQSATQYPQVDGLYIPANGYFPLAPWAGLAVLAAWAAVAFGSAALLLRGRDA